MRQDTRDIKWNISGEGLSWGSVANYILRLVKFLSGQQNDIFSEFDNPQNGCEKFLIFLWQRYKRSEQSLTHLSLIYYLMIWPALLGH